MLPALVSWNMLLLFADRGDYYITSDFVVTFMALVRAGNMLTVCLLNVFTSYLFIYRLPVRSVLYLLIVCYYEIVLPSVL